ncbi:hypothetical protein JQ607_02835 [Bradyrhizobium liaoningense]|uniref:hypothetical protein n=1 Tax=Bradyrhizobium liaoningense TaxID=43992 RepID=UPI001BA50D54|nr:hypothetical protein [Bradyrhizobium liaoningense]MBR0839119.1 hypothetical protein [Bradyrhizobium liaoningense]
MFEFAVLGGIVMLSRTRAYKQARHDYALEAGRAAIEQHKPAPRYKRQDRKSYEKYRYHDFSNVGSAAYSKGHGRFKLKGPLPITVSHAELLRAAGLSPSQSHQTKNRRALQSALERLTEPVVSALPPALRGIKQTGSGALRLIIDPKWLPASNYGRVLWPPPKSGSKILALYLFIAGCQLQSDIPSSIARLYRRIGIRKQQPGHALRVLEHALDGVNKHLAMAKDDLERGFPRKIRHKFIRDGQYVRFVAVYTDKERERRRIDKEWDEMREADKRQSRITAREKEDAERWYDEQEKRIAAHNKRVREKEGYYDDF